jgi:hypothetical protein
MKLALIALALSVSAFSGPIGPAPLTGSGSFSWSFDVGTDVTLQASNQSVLPEDLVSFSINTFWGGAGGFLIVPGNTVFPGIGGAGYSSGFATIGPVTSQYFTVFLGDRGTLTLYDGVAGSIIASVSISAYEGITSERDSLDERDGTLGITATPEPATWPLTAGGLSALWWRKKVERKRGIIKIFLTSN